MKKNRLLVLLVGLVLIVGVAIAFPLFSHDGEKTESGDGTVAEQGGAGGSGTEDGADAAGEPETVSIEIACVGDVMGHMSQVNAAAQGDGTYNFEDHFAYVKDYITEADMALCNIETTFDGEPYMGYPAFSTPDELAEALRKVGFDVAMTANNHMNDRGADGISRTLEVLKQNGFVTTGSTLAAGEPRYAMVNVKGVNVAVIAYTYETPAPGGGGGVYLNGGRVSDEAAARINSFSYNSIDADLAAVCETAAAARDSGAEIVIVYYHWGEEYQTSANKWQRYMAEKTVELADVDAIFASHPHNLQEAEYIGGVPVFYSLGNFISNQRVETLGENRRYTETGVIAKVKIDYNKTDGTVTSAEMSAIPTWVDRYTAGGKLTYAVVPLDDALAENAALAASGHLTRAKGALEDANGLLKMD